MKFLLTLLLVVALMSTARAAPDVKLHMLVNASVSETYPVDWPGGVGVFSVVGTFTGCTVTLEFLGPDGVTYLPAGSATTLTSAGAGVFYLPHRLIIAVISGGSPSGIYAEAGLVQN
jgi:hypothetical protein